MVFICDTTLRDGEQAAGVAFSVEEKVTIARMLDEAGVHEIEAGTPAMGGTEKESVAAIAALGLKARVMAWNRAVISDIEASAEAGVKAVGVSLPVSDIMISRKLRRDRAWVLGRVIEAVSYAKDRGFYVCAGAEDSSRADEAFLDEYAGRARDCGADRLRFCDTVGVLDPFMTVDKVGRLASAAKIQVEVHAHNDFGLATANACAGVRAGAAFVSTTILGIGERAGNAATEEVVMALKHLHGIDTGIDARKLARACAYVARASGRPIPAGKPIVGGRIFQHESGIHADGVIKWPGIYEAYMPEEVGLGREVIIGKHSGRAALIHRFRGMGITVTPQDASEMLMEIRRVSAGLKRELTDEELFNFYKSRHAA